MCVCVCDSVIIFCNLKARSIFDQMALDFNICTNNSRLYV